MHLPLLNGIGAARQKHESAMDDLPRYDLEEWRGEYGLKSEHTVHGTTAGSQKSVPMPDPHAWTG